MPKNIYIYLIVICSLAAMQFSCSGKNEPASPLETFKTYVKALKQKDITTMKMLLTAESLQMLEREAKAQGVTVDDVVKKETLFTENQKTIEFRNEKIDGQKATIEVKNQFGTWETVPFAFEDGQWKIDKKGYLDRFSSDIEEKNQNELDKIINQGKQP
jgi:hypothetical protein